MTRQKRINEVQERFVREDRVRDRVKDPQCEVWKETRSVAQRRRGREILKRERVSRESLTRESLKRERETWKSDRARAWTLAM